MSLDAFLRQQPSGPERDALLAILGKHDGEHQPNAVDAEKIGRTKFRLLEDLSMNRRIMLTTLAASAFIPAFMAAPTLFAADSITMGDAEKKHAE
jgi:hypothetical protein